MAAAVICGYARVSTDAQAWAVALNNQVERLKESGCDRVYVDIASRADNRREGLQQLLDAISKGTVSEVRIVRLDRLTSSPGMFEDLISALNAKSVPLVGLDEHIDIKSVDGEFSAGLQIYFSKRELGTIRLRSQRGHESRRRNERANSSVPIGFRAVNRRYALDNTPFLCLLEDKPASGDHPGRTIAELCSDVIATFFECRSLSKTVEVIHRRYGIYKQKVRRTDVKALSTVIEGEDTLRDIVGVKQRRKGLFQWTHDGLAKWLRNPVLRGHTPYNTRQLQGLDSAGRKQYGKAQSRSLWDVKYGTHPDQTLLTEAQYQAIENIIQHNAKTRGYAFINGSDRRYPISGLLVCGVCGSRMKSQASKLHADGVRHNYYRCKASLEAACDNRVSIRNDRAEAAIIEALTKRAIAIAELAQQPVVPITSPELAALKSQLAAMMAIPGNNPAIEMAKNELQGQIERMERAIEGERSRSFEKGDQLAKLVSEEGFWESLSGDEKSKLFRWLVRDVVVNGSTVEVLLDF